MSDNDKREIKQVYSKSQHKMVALPEDARPSVAAYRRFKATAFVVPPNTRRVKSEREKTEG